MNRDNTIEGIDVAKHPYAHLDGFAVKTYSKQASVLAAQADNPGVIKTPEGEMTFQAGDYIVTDNPPTHAWPVRQQVFESTYAEVGAGHGPKIVDQDVATLSDVVEGLPKGIDQRGFPPQGQPPVPGYAAEAEQHAKMAHAAAARQQSMRDRPSPRLAAGKAAGKAPAARPRR